jgi:Ubiquitin carboxyl-terminal hydrolase
LPSGAVTLLNAFQEVSSIPAGFVKERLLQQAQRLVDDDEVKLLVLASLSQLLCGRTEGPITARDLPLGTLFHLDSMGAATSGPSKFERDLQELKNDKRNLSLEGQHFFGFENFGNTCYCNSVLQALYYCVPFRDHLLARSKSPGDASLDGKNARFSNSFPTNTILYQLAELFHEISNKKQVHGYHAPTPFLQVLREGNEIFRGNMQQVRSTH